ncbi:MAG: DUF4126 domain-containing protein [Flavobacteriales bacterium]|nr:DUF4126 domain-containing protein [Flavobacteriales bacterium]
MTADLGPTVLSILLGIALAAACGFRVFLPLFIAALFTRYDVGGIGLNESFAWMGEWPAVIALGVATVVELLAYYIPFVDHALDVAAVPLSTVAGAIIALGSFVDLPPYAAWGLAIVAGGGLAGLVSAGTATTRVASTTTTAGLGNPVLATAETGGAVGLSLLAWFLPLVAGVFLLLLVVLAVRRLARGKG